MSCNIVLSITDKKIFWYNFDVVKSLILSCYVSFMILCHCQAEQYLIAFEVYYTFFVTCFKSSSFFLLSLRYHTNTGGFVIQKGSSPKATTRLPLGNPTHGYIIGLEIQIIDSLGAAWMKLLTVTVCNQHQLTPSNIH